MDNSDQPNSICHVQPIQMYHLTSNDSEKPLPFGLLAGEVQVHHGTSVDGLVVITNYRLFLQVGQTQYHIPLGLIEMVENRELFYLQIGCKDARTYRCTFENNESCLEWYDRILKAAEPPRQLEQLFAFYHFMWTKESANSDVMLRIDRQKQYSFDRAMFDGEMARMDFGFSWRISKVNINYKLCPTYPPFLLVPSCISDEILESVAKFRSSRRIPAVVWRHSRNGAVIARCSQPEVGWLGWRSAEDEDLIKAISDACNFEVDRDEMSLHSDMDALQITNNVANENKKVLIMDARSYTTAVANRARGGGCECPEYYPNCEIQFMNLANIHSIRKSFHALRQLCTSSAEQPNWFSQLEGTRWLLNMSGLMKAAVTLVKAVEIDGRPVLVHCSDGWDRTPQIVALAELLLDPFYRTCDGFRTLIEREWLAFGHKFADRCGHSTGSDDQNERCPVFLQWLDCVHQLLIQFPCAFEFTQTYLVKLAQHTYSNLFGTFLCNTQQERQNIVYGKTFSVWEFLGSGCFKNHLYAPLGHSSGALILWPRCNVRDLTLWSEVYLGSMEASGACPGPPEAPPHHMTKTRSYGDLLEVGGGGPVHNRRNSDPNLTIEECNNKDCMFQSRILTDDQIDDFEPPSDQIVIPEKTDTDTDNDKLIDSVDTSTETLVSDNVSPKEMNGFEKILSPIECIDDDGCHMCRLNAIKPSQTSGEGSQQSTPRFFSRTSSSNGWDALSCGQSQKAGGGGPFQIALSDDGLVPLKSPIQERLDQILEDQKKKEELLQKELHTYRQARIKLVCHRCNGLEPERQDDNSESDVDSNSSCSSSSSAQRRNSVAESAGEEHASGVESLRSDLSWEAVDDAPSQTLWVPDHAVTTCTACKIEFWMGRRKHHCRKCGRIFCADCSVHSTPLPSEHLYNPVRVCTLCYSKLHRNHDDTTKTLFEDKCNHHAPPPTTNNPQIAASTN